MSDLVSWFDTTKYPHLSKNGLGGFLGILCRPPKVELSCKTPNPCELQLLSEEECILAPNCFSQFLYSVHDWNKDQSRL